VNTRLSTTLAWLLTVFGLEMGIVRASTFLELQSTYLGAGWFQYQMKVLNDPFFTQVNVTGVQVGFTNETDHSTSATNWGNTDWTNAYSSWSFTNYVSPTPPFAITWRIRSSETAFKLQTNNFNGDALVMSFLNMTGIYPGVLSGVVWGQNILGCANLPCLVPCRPEEADNSPTNFVYDLKLAPDVVIKQMIQTNGGIYGVDFQWDSAATFLLQGTADFKNWTNIAYIWSTPPETLWTTNQTLSSRGSFYRLELMTDGYSTNVPPLGSNLKFAPNLFVPRPTVITGCRLNGGSMVVAFTSSPGQSCSVQALDSSLVIRQSQQVIPSSTSASASFDPVSLPNPVFFRIVLQ